MNKVIELGRITRDIEVKQTASGKKCAVFSIAVDKGIPKAKQQAGQPTADFFNCVAWEHNAEFLGKYFSKGSQILIEGRLSSRSYDKNGQKVYVTEIICDHFDFVGPRQQPQQTAPMANSFGAPAGNDEIPW